MLSDKKSLFGIYIKDNHFRHQYHIINILYKGHNAWLNAINQIIYAFKSTNEMTNMMKKGA